MMTKHFLGGLALITCAALSSTADADTFNLDWSNLSAADFSATATGISRTLGGVTVTATGYSVSVDPDDGTETLTGPLPAIDIAACTNLNPALCPGGRANGLRLSRAGLGIRAEENTAVGLGGYTDAGLAVAEFIAFTFSTAVNIGSILVDDVSNAPRPIWFASSESAVDLSGGLGSALSALGLVNSPDDATDGLFSHAANLSGITTLLVGAPFRSGDYLGITPRNANFYVQGFGDISLAQTDGGDPGTGDGDPSAGDGGNPAPIPLPAGLPLVLSGLIALGLVARGRKTA